LKLFTPYTEALNIIEKSIGTIKIQITGLI